jgi:hypothetical protein
MGCKVVTWGQLELATGEGRMQLAIPLASLEALPAYKHLQTFFPSAAERASTGVGLRWSYHYPALARFSSTAPASRTTVPPEPRSAASTTDINTGAISHARLPRP